MSILRAADWYDSPLYYDIIFDQHTEAEVPFVEALYQRYVVGELGDKVRRRVLEPGCGSGRLIPPLVERGFEVSGFDLSKPMLDFARLRCERAGVDADGYALKVGSMAKFEYRGKFDLAHCFVSTFKYLLTEQDAVSHLQCVARCLRRGGIYLLGFHLTEYEGDEGDEERWKGSRDGVSVICDISSTAPDRRERLESMCSRMQVRRERRLLECFQTEWQFRTYSDNQFESLLRRVPELRLAAVHDFDYDPASTHQLGYDRLDVVVVLQRV